MRTHPSGALTLSRCSALFLLSTAPGLASSYRFHAVWDGGKLSKGAFERLRPAKSYPAEKIKPGSEPDEALCALADYEAGRSNIPEAIEIYKKLLGQWEPKPDTARRTPSTRRVCTPRLPRYIGEPVRMTSHRLWRSAAGNCGGAGT